MLGPVTKNTNIFSLVATILFILTIFAAGGLFVYQKIIEKQIKDADIELASAREAFETGEIQELIDASIKINSIKDLLDKHFAVSELMIELQRLTLKNVRFSNFSFKNSEGNHFLSMDGEGLSYNALAKQSEAFSDSGFIKNTEFSDFALSNKGTVNFKFNGSVDSSRILYRKSVEAPKVESETQI